MNRHTLIIILLLVFITNDIFAQINGLVIDATNRSPLPFATIQFGNGLIITSDEKGEFSIPEINYPATLVGQYLGYESKTITLTKFFPSIMIELKPAEFMLGEVIVSAYSQKQSIIETAGSVSLISKKELKVDNDVNVVSSLNRVPGLYMQSGTYNTNRLMIRGIGSRSLFSTTKIRAYFKEIPLTTGDGETSIEDIDPNLIERIEIVKGPSSSLYGAGLGGTLLISPKMPSLGENNVTYQITAGSYGYLKNNLSFDKGTEKSRLSLMVNNIHSDGYRENNQFDRFSSGLSFQSFLTSKTTLNLLANYIDLKAYIPSSINEEMYQTDPRAAATNWADAEGFEDYYKMLTGISISHQFNSNSILDASLFGTKRKAYEQRPFNILKENTYAIGGRFKYNYIKKFNRSSLDLLTGLEYFHDNYDWQTVEIINQSEGDLISDNLEMRSNINAFFRANYVFPFSTELSVGFNINQTGYDYQDVYSLDSINDSRKSNFGTIFSPRVAITHPITENINLYGTISQGFSPPTLPETLTPDGTINPDIQPEKGINYEIGSKGLFFHHRFYYEISLFSMHITDLLVAERIGEDEFIGVNAGKTQHNGIELTLNYDFLNSPKNNNKLYGFITYTLANYLFKEFINGGIDYSGNALTGVSKNVFNGGLSMNLSSGLYANLNYQFVDKMPMRDDNSVYSDAFSIVNLRLGYTRILWKHLKMDIYGIVNNLTSTKYASMISVNAAGFGGNAPRYYYPGMPLNAYTGLSVSYLF